VNTTLLSVENLTKVFKTGVSGKPLVAVDNVSFQLGEGEILSLLGESGSGKSTIARMVLRFLKPTRGRVLYRGRDVWKMRGRELLDYYREVQGVFQDPYSSFNPVHRVEHHLKQVLKNLLGEESVDDEQVIREAMERVGLNPHNIMGKYPHELSGGQLQRLSIARALLAKPRLLIADEPVSMIDVSMRTSILKLLLEFKREYNMSMIMITHDLAVARLVADRIAVMYLGKIVEVGPTEEVLRSPRHPYTEALIAAAPTIVRSAMKPKLRIRGEIADPSKIPSGCRFHPRCPYSDSKRCVEEEPAITYHDGRGVACHYPLSTTL